MTNIEITFYKLYRKLNGYYFIQIMDYDLSIKYNDLNFTSLLKQINYPLTEPAVKPSMKYLLKNIYNINIGKMENIEPATNTS